jgi:tRNA(Ile)-lysidine synthase
MVLLHLLNGLRRPWRLDVRVFHVNHLLRGAESNGDARLVETTCDEYHIPFSSARVNASRLANRQGVSIEMAAREARHAFLAKAALKHGCQVVCLAHHADDQAELFFLRLLRGSGPEGLSGMQIVAPSPADARVRLARPLLEFRRAELENYARTHRIEWREDSSNESLDHLRNRVRHTLLPSLARDFQPAVCENIVRVMDLLFEEQAAIAQLAAEWRSRPSEDRRAFQELPIGLQRRIIHDQMLELGVHPTFDACEFLRRHAEKPLSLKRERANGKTTEISCSRSRTGALTILPVRAGEDFADASEEQRVELKFGPAPLRIHFGKRVLELSVRPVAPIPRNPNSPVITEHFDARTIGKEVVFRYWRPGDRFQPIGMAHEVKLQDFFVNRKVPRLERHQRLIAVDASGRIFWVEGERISERHRVTSQTERVLRLTWRGKRSARPLPFRRGPGRKS